MDKITRENAANAEESSAAASTLNSQAERMKNYVGELMGLVEGRRQFHGSNLAITGLGMTAQTEIRSAGH